MGNRIAAVSFALMALGGAVISAGYWPANPGWMVATGAGTTLHAFVAVLLWRRVEWAPAVGLGLAGFSAGVWLQSLIALSGSDVSLASCAAGLGLSLATFGLLFLIPRRVSRRHGTSLAFAGAACVPGLVFALVPAQTIGVAAAMLVGSAALLTGSVFLGRGRTFGLLLNIAGAVVIAGRSHHELDDDVVGRLRQTWRLSCATRAQPPERNRRLRWRYITRGWRYVPLQSCWC